MSEQTPPSPPPANEPSPEPAAGPAAKKKRKKRTWKQRLKLTALIVIIGVLLFRIALSLLLPTVIRKVANAYDLDCAYDRINLSTLGGNAQIWGLTLRPKAGGDSIVNADYVQGTISAPNLLRGRLVVYRAEVDGVDVFIDRQPDGAIPFLKTLAPTNKAHPATAAPTAKGNVTPVDFEPPLRVDAVRLSHVNTRLRDRSVSPPFEATIQTTVRVSNIGSVQVPARFELEVAADPLFDTLLVRGEMHSTPTSVDGALDVTFRGIHPKPAVAYLLPLGLRPVANTLSVRAKVGFKAAVIPNTPDVSANLTIEEVSANADNEEWAALDRLTVSARRLSATTVELGEMRIEGGRARARRTPTGGVRVAGLELAPAAEAANRSPSPSYALPHGFRFVLDELRLKDLQAMFDDEAVDPWGKLTARLDAMSIKNVVLDAAHPDEKATIAGSASVPGVIRDIELSGSATPFAGKSHLDLKLAADGIKPDALAPYLARLAIESELHNGRFTGELSATLSEHPDGALTADAGISGIRFSDGADLLSMGAVKVGGATLDPKTGAIKVASIELSGPALAARRQASGSLAALGLRTRAAGPLRPPWVARRRVASQGSPAVAATPPSTRLLPRIEIGKFVWKDVKLQFSDEIAGADQSISVGDAGIEASDLVIDPQSKTPSRPGRFRAWLSAPKLADRLAVEGTLTPGARGIAIDSVVTGAGMRAEAIAPYLKPLGIVPVLTDGRLDLNAKATVAMNDSGLASSLHLENVSYKDGKTELAGVDSLNVSELAIKPSGVEIGQVQIDRPRADLARNADGSFQVMGVRVAAAAPASQLPSTASPAPLTPTPTTSRGSLKLRPSSIVATLKGLHLRDGSIRWRDSSASKPVNLTIVGAVDLDDLRIGRRDAAAARLNVTSRIDGVVDKATITGTLTAEPDAPGAKLKIVADGIRAGELAAYLPAGLSSTLKDGHFSGALDVGISNHPVGGLAGHLTFNDVDLYDAPDEPLLKLRSLEIAASRIDPDGGVIAIDTIASAGLEADMRLGADGAIDLLGMRLAHAVTPSSHPASVSRPPADASPATEPASDLRAMIAQSRKPFPLLTVGNVDLGVRRLTITGATGPGAAPVSLENLVIRNRGPIEVGGSDAETRQPLVLEALGKITPVIGSFRATAGATPMAVTPTIKLDINASDIDGNGLTDLLPQLKPAIDGTGLTRGTFRSHLDATLNYGRRGPRDLDLARGFTLDADIKPVEFKSDPDGPVLAGLDEIRSDGIKFEPKTGDVLIKAIEITRPAGRIVRDEKGIHALGLLIPVSTPSTQPADRKTEPAVVHAPALSTNQPGAEPSPVRPTHEIRLDRLTVSGIDLTLQDTTTTPNTLVPLNGLDVDVRHISNLMPFDEKPMRFSVLLTSDKVPLPFRKGAVGSSAGAPQATAAGTGTELRELFSQITADGTVTIRRVGDHFALDGWTKTSINGFELLGIAGLAKQHKVTIGGGVLDDANDIRFNPSGRIETRNSIVLTNLSLSEPLHGPIQTALKIQAPIDVAIGLITDPDDSITLKLPVPIKNGAVSRDDLIGPAMGAAAGVLTTAIASAPVKTVAGVGNLLGLGGSGKPASVQTIVVHFLPGYTGLDGPSSRALERLVQRMRREPTLQLQLRHELSTADVVRAAVRANPTPEECRSLAERLRHEKSELLAHRAVLAGWARGKLGSRPESQARTTLDSLRAIDRQIAQTENALDQLYDQLRPGAARQRDRRTRAAGLEISQQRLAVVRNVLLSAGIAGADERVHQTNPRFAPNDSDAGGQVIITLVAKKK